MVTAWCQREHAAEIPQLISCGTRNIYDAKWDRAINTSPTLPNIDFHQE